MQPFSPGSGIYRDRADAGKQVAAHLVAFADDPDVLVLGLPRGGVAVAYEVAAALHTPLDILVVRKLGVPDEPELAMGAIASGGIRVLNAGIIRALGISDDVVEAVTLQEQRELARREHLYRGEHPPLYLRGRIAIVVDDGIATGASERAAVVAARRLGASRCIVAVPVTAAATFNALRVEGIEVMSVHIPHDLYAIGRWYEEFPQITDAEVRELLDRAWRAHKPVPQ